ncbi:putative T6SS immunity periplasmic lipoprotein [Pantoea sp. BAV 3049]|uniref:putative T6SS immunity periplasmic lipoprotein n=1 Tax=Pantoea sp. BAV 3049 TaxID=2654188 RepID=UPI00131DB9A1|nr:putative T6SS immunity periplasmic lipoprotein [Pantoea sp. BAV 3049]
MKKLITIFSTLLLVGCPGAGDRYYPPEHAEVAIRNNAVCVTVSPEGDEKVQSVLIHRNDSNQQVKDTYIDKSYFLTKDDCIGTNGYKFLTGVPYTVSVNLNSKKKADKKIFPSSRLFITEFSLETTRGQLSIER